MTQDRWSAVDDYLCGQLVPADEVLESALWASAAAGLPEISVSPAQGKMLHLLARAQGARRILEIGTLGGYSAIWLARALPPDGHLITLEADTRHAEVARENLALAGLADRTEVRVGRAQETLPHLIASGAGAFDLIFIDADKPGYPDYLRWSLDLARPGTVLVADNVVRDGAVADPASTDPNVRGMRQFIELLAAEPRVSATAIQTVGSKGYDGFVLAVVVAGQAKSMG
jgi:predicted O-methyltransferase YrrM